MSRTFADARVSTVEQNSKNQLQEIEAAGFKIQSHRIMTETVSGLRAVEQFERDLLIERTQSGLARAKKKVKP